MSRVTLIGITKPVVEDLKTAEDLIVYMARVSNPDNQKNTGTGPKLINYLVKNNHWSPLEMVSVVMEIETTRDIARQILRHRSFSFQEFSQRYADPVKDLGFITRHARLQDTKNRQNSIETHDEWLATEWQAKQLDLIKKQKEVYAWALDKNIAKEQARAVLSEGLIISRMYMAGTLRSWIHYINLRSGNGTQKEHREIALKCKDIIIKNFGSMKDYLNDETQE